VTATEEKQAGQRAAADRLRAVTAQRQQARQLEDQWRAAVLAALAAGLSGPEVGALAGVTKERVYQIRDGRR
jgi:hypothetical protein